MNKPHAELISTDSERPSQRFQTAEDTHGSSARPPRRNRAMLVLICALVFAGLGGLFGKLFSKHAPSDPTRPKTVEPFSLRDTQGKTYTLADWQGAKAIALFVIGRDDPTSSGSAEMRRLHEHYRSKNTMFLGISPEPNATAEAVAKHAKDLGFTFPILLDPAQELTMGLGVRTTPSIAVLDDQGHVLYQGAMPSRSASSGSWSSSANQSPAEEAIVAVLNDRPVTAPTEAQTSRLPLPKPRPIIALDEKITFHEHVAPVLWKHCAACHRPGEVGPFPLLTYRDAAKRAQFLADVAGDRRMPPWRAMHGYGDFQATGRLSRRELAVLSYWSEHGSPEGDAALAKTPPQFPEGWQLGTPDFVVTMPEPFLIPANTTDYYRAFVLPLPVDQDVAIAAVEFRPGNHRVVHHARFFYDPKQDCRKRDEADETQGFPSFGGGDIFKPGLGAWIPGAIPQLPPPDVGKIVRRGSDLIMLVHYHGTGKDELDRSSLGIFLCKTPPKRSITHISLSSAKIDIPAGEKRHRMALTTKLLADAHGVSVMPHGHFLMREISLTAILPSGRVIPMLWVDDWDFNWQGQYYFARPVPLPKGTRLDVVAYYDNSAENPANPNKPPRRVKFGYASTDEMLGCHVQVIADDASAQRVFDEKLSSGL